MSKDYPHFGAKSNLTSEEWWFRVIQDTFEGKLYLKIEIVSIDKIRFFEDAIVSITKVKRQFRFRCIERRIT